MASELGVQTIQHTNGTDAITVGSTGIITQPKMPFFMANLSSDQSSITDNTETVIQFNNRVEDPDSLWDTSNYRLTVDANTKGYWWVHVSLYTNSTNNVENSRFFFRVNGTKVTENFGGMRSSAGSGTPHTEALYSGSAVVDLTTASDYLDVSLKVDVSSGGTTTVNETGPYTRTYICGHRLR